jgi:hypothetical protein
VHSNIADPRLVKEAEEKAKAVRKQELNDIRTVLSNASGRRFLWRILSRCKTFGSIFDESNPMMCYLSGQQDLGHYLMAEIAEADENLLFKLMKDNKKGDIDE